MHENSAGRIEPVRNHVEPGLPRHQITDLHHAHRVVGIDEGTGLPNREHTRPRQNKPERERRRDRQRNRRDRRRIRAGPRGKPAGGFCGRHESRGLRAAEWAVHPISTIL
jgi:hypothetical protein